MPYYMEARPAISDYEYDDLMERALRIEKEHPEWVDPTLPTQRMRPHSPKV